MATVKHMLTTIDNPYDPFDEFDLWLGYDESNGYFSSPLLARVAYYSDEMSEADQDLAIDKAIDEIIKEDPLLIFKKVSKEV
jgi:hypothetical protein